MSATQNTDATSTNPTTTTTNEPLAKKPAEDVIGPITIDELRDIEIHGLFSLYRAQTTKEKIFWSTILLAFLCLLIYELIQTVNDYINQPILTTYSAIAKTSMEFPDVYICPTNFINQTKLDNLDDSQKSWLQIYSVFRSKLYTNSLLREISTPWEQMNDIVQHQHDGGKRATVTTKKSKVQPTPDNVQQYFMDLGYDLEEFVKECTFNGEKVGCSNITSAVLDRDYGKCFLIEVKPKEQTTPGLGLRLMLDVNTDLYENSDPKLLDGAHVFIEHHFEPTISQKVLVQPGTYSSISLELKKMRFLNYKKDDVGQHCFEDISDVPKLEIMNGTYSPTLCEMDCVQKSALASCKCILTVDKQFIREDVLNKPNMVFCDPEALEQCIYGKPYESEKQVIKDCSEKCSITCDAWEYNLYVSSLKFPSKRVIKDPDLYKKLQSDYILLDVSFDEMQMVQIAQHLGISLDTFIGNAGGQLSLWFGMSLLTVIQASVLLFRFCRYKVITFYRSRKSKSS